MHCVKQTFEERKVLRLGKFKSKLLISEAALWCLRTDLQEGLQDKSDAPAEMRGNLPGKSASSKQEDKATFYSPSDEWIFRAASTFKTEEREFVVDSGASIHMVSKKDLNSAELDTVKISSGQKPHLIKTHVSLMTHGSSDRPRVDRSSLGSPKQPVLPPRVWLPIVRTCFIHCTSSRSGKSS